eukprot:TRINITY_DN293_c0_g2_i1.p1 TRINITY_DN293_c0_g2~~TRINITY_DN293_c0_g2_i1.p1  ORF type:complete len:488 (-),score=299.50 TRINITY_DN293_c0_g2_i1:48-1511(-)
MATRRPFVPKKELIVESAREAEKRSIYSSVRPGAKGDSKYYAIARGKSSGVVLGWDRAEPLVTGYSPVKRKPCCYRAFDREQDAWNWLADTKPKLTRKYKKNRRVTKTRPIPGKKDEEEEYETEEEYFSFEDSSEDEVARGPRRPAPPAPPRKMNASKTDTSGFSQVKSDRVWLVEEEPEQVIEQKEADVNLNGTPVAAQFTIGAVIGRGAFAVVKSAKQKQGNRDVALKILGAEINPEFNASVAAGEIQILRQIGTHANIVSLIADFSLGRAVVLALELVPGGELLPILASSTTPYMEEQARSRVAQLVDAVEALHSRNIIHRDLTPENLLLVAKNETAALKLCGFSAARSCPAQLPFDGFVGTVTIQPPEIVTRQSSSKASDMWSVGVLAYVLLSGKFPFQDSNQMRLSMKIRKGEYAFPDPDWRPVSENAKQFIRALINPDANSRITAQQAKVHPWLSGAGARTPIPTFRASIKASVEATVWAV